MALVHSPKIITNGLVLSLDAANTKSYPGSGTTWFNQVNDINGVINDTSVVVHDSTNGTFTFNGEDNGSYVDFASSSPGSTFDFLGRAPFSWEIWCKPDNYPGAPSSQWRRLFDRENNPGSGRDGWLCWLNFDQTDYNIGFERFENGTQTVPNYNLPVGQIIGKHQHFMGTYDGTTMRIYWKGYQVTSATSTVSITNTGLDLRLGGDGNSNAGFIGEINVARIWNRALSGTEVRQCYDALKGRFGL